jgi:uncharacterized lipoprotein
MIRRHWILVLLLTIACGSGCGLSTERIQINYLPQEGPARIKGAEGTRVRVEVSDLRSKKAEVSKKGDEYEMLAPILADNDIAETLKQAIEGELKRRGFEGERSEVIVQVELSKFYNRFRASNSEAELFMHVQVRKPGATETLLFSSIVRGEGIESGVALRSGANAKKALEAALRDGVEKLMADVRFTDALLAAGKR